MAIETSLLPEHQVLTQNIENRVELTLMAGHDPKPDLFQFLDYREFMKAMVDHLRSKNQYSIRKFAAKVGFKSSAFMKMVMNGRRNLSGESVRRVASGFGLNKTELRLFELLVAFNQSSHLQEKDDLFRELMSFKRFQASKKLVAAQYDFFKHWYIIAILEAIGSRWGRKKPGAMAKSLGITERQASDAIDLLLKLDLIERKNSVLRRKDSVLETPSQTENLNIRNFHREMIQKAQESIENLPTQERALGGVTIALSKRAYEQVQKKMHKICQEVAVNFADDSDAEKIFQLSFQIFPLLNLNDADD